MARRTKEAAEETYQALLHAAATLFMERGVAVTTLNDIAKAAGVTRGALYWHFEGKDDIIRSLWASYAAPKIEPFQARLRDLPKNDPVPAFQAIQRDFLQLVLEDHKLGQAVCIVICNVEATEGQSALQTYLLEEKAKLIDAFGVAFTLLAQAGKVSCDLPPSLLVQSFLAYMTGLLDQHFSPLGSIDLEQEGEALLNVFYTGLFRQQAPLP